MGYFFSDGQNSSDRLDMLYKARDVRELANFQAIGLVPDLNDPNLPDSIMARDINWIDSNQGVLIDDFSNLSTELLKSDLIDDVASVNILVDGEVVETIQPEQLTDSPLGLTFEGTVENLDVSLNAENLITAEVVYTPQSNLATTTVDFTVTSGESTGATSTSIADAGNGDGEDTEPDPFKIILEGSKGNDTIRAGYTDLGINGGAGSDRLVGNKRDNILDGGTDNDNIIGHGGNDTITTGEGQDRADGGEGIDTVVYDDQLYAESNIRQAGKIVNVNLQFKIAA